MRRLALLACAAACAAPGLTLAQQAAASPVDCPKAAEVRREDLLGLWRAEFEGLGHGATLLLEQHPELSESVRGAINRNGERAQLAGDVDAGEFSLEESVNGVNISAVWLGDVVQGSCGREIRGAWKAEGDPRQRQFVLRKQ